ncbi:ATP-binding cassette domain-containing protein [Streptacidiphilus sp. PB12-B1b]|uniref:ABC transporter ATP-binding protein n=1 Tax=Streptacidiphilus sp. PB12-B1b TaxID=2705012 RepID=UPI0015FAF861|nr:ATP-binding cassette domain-containing protein [Streptacidiphilus sp. PB12-B1b]QMU77848.1 ATP-binding cassette domain-containing protein [Streptacidiphilus sp. PB12-B1b]
MSRQRSRLSAQGLVCRFGGVTALDRACIEVPPGLITALTGANGAGKSTLFRCLSGALRPDAGRVLLDGRDITGLPEYARARLGLARTFQQVAVFAGLSVLDNLRVGAEQAGGRGPRESAAAVARTLRLLGLERVADRPAAALPTGTLRLVELGRALAADPGVLLLDEPAAGLDREQAERLAVLLTALAGDGLAVLLVEHDRELVDRIADRVHTMADGRIAGGSAADGR